MQRRHTVRAIGAVAVSLVALVVAIIVLGFHWALLPVEAAVIGTVLALDAAATPIIDRWRRGAEGEELVGQIVGRLGEYGWFALHDVHLGNGNIDHILIGPAGIYTVETKSHRGRFNAAKLDRRMLKQAYAEAKLIERITGLRTQPLLVFSNAYLIPAVSRQDGVVVLPARLLARHLQQRRGNIPAARVFDVYRRLADALPG